MALRLPRLRRATADPRPSIVERARALIARRKPAPAPALDADRRKVMAGALVAAVVPWPTVSAGSRHGAANPDAELMALGRELAEKWAAWTAYFPTYEAASDRIEAGKVRHRSAFDAVRGQGDEAFFRVWTGLFREEDAIISHGSDLSEAADAAQEAIFAIPPRTLVGLAVHCQALAWTFERAWDRPEDDCDWDLRCVRRVVETVHAMAGVPLPIRTRLTEA